MKSFYQKIQDKLYAHPSPVETDELWQNIYAELHPQRKRRGIFWWFAGLAVLLVGLAGSWYLWQDASTEVANNLSEISLVESPVKIPAIQPAATISHSTQQATAPATSILPPVEKSPKLLAVIPADIPEPASSNSVLESEKKFPALTKPEESSTIMVIQNEQIQSPEKRSSFSVSPVIPGYAVFAEGSADHSFDQSITFPLKNKARSPFSIGIQTGIFRASRQFEADPSNQELINNRLATESALETIELGLSASYQHPSGFYLRSGLAYTRINERFQWQTNLFGTDTLSNALLEVELDINGDTLNKLFGYGLSTTTALYKNTTYNSIQRLDIPVILGYRLSRYPWHLGLEAGVYLNLRQMAEGRILNSRREISELETDRILKPSVGLSLYTSVRLSYQLSDQWEIAVAPGLRYQLGSNSQKEYELKQRYHLFGLQASLYHLF